MTNLLSIQKNIHIWLGGSFDPVHQGHLAIIEHVATVLTQYICLHNLQNICLTVSFLPTAGNPLKANPTVLTHRLAMLELVLTDLQQQFHDTKLSIKYNNASLINFKIDTTEILQHPPIFTFNTFSQFRKIYPNDSLIFVLGMDSIASFDKWYRANELPNLCHLWVMPRSTTGLEGDKLPNAPFLTLSTTLSPFITFTLHDLINTPNGHIYMDSYQVPSVSSSQIRAILADDMMDKSLLQQWLTPSVLAYILTNGLYQR